MAVSEDGGRYFGLGVQIAAPVLSATLAADMVLGLLGKASPQMPLMLLGPAIKSILGILDFVRNTQVLAGSFPPAVLDSMTNGEQLFHLAR